ncbi:MAG: citrate/2-methylcitrate synthase, partial [Pseudomonadota bacterium]|nr:citrate/2-methylcitrate synthase [Pseudomonadota bacterium]
MAEKKLGGAGLRGQSAGETALCTVGKSGSGLTYRGYDIKELAEKVSFEEVAYLLAKGELPNQAELDAYRKRLKSMRILPQEVKDVLERIPKEAHPMDVLRTGCSMLGNLETEESFDEADDKIERMIATFPGMVLYWYRFTHDGVRIDTDSEEQSTGAHFLRLLHDESPSKLHADVMNTSL